MQYPYIPNSNEAVRKEMLDFIGAKSVEEIYSFIPDEVRMKKPLDIPAPFTTEQELSKHMNSILAEDSTCEENISFLGAGCYDHYVPAICDEINGRSEFLTAYSGDTYADHGKCQAFFEFSSMMGELLDLDGRIHALGDWVERRFAKKQSKTSISEGFVNASLLFCVGAMAIMGALDSGLTGDHATLYAKSTLDGIISIVYGSAMGAGVALSGVAVFLYQGLITLCASFIAPFLSEVVIAEMKCVGSLLIIGLSFNMLGMTKIKVMNYVPAVFFPILLCTFM